MTDDRTSKLDLDFAKVDACRDAAREIADDMEEFVHARTTVAVERTVLRLFGIDGVSDDDVPLPNVVVDQLVRGGSLSDGVTRSLCSAMIAGDRDPQSVARAAAAGEIDLGESPTADAGRIAELGHELATDAVAGIRAARDRRDALMAEREPIAEPRLYVIVATGNIYEDAVQAKTAAHQGADVVAVIRSTGQSLLDYVPYGDTTEGFGGTFATQANFAIMREALDEVGERLDRYIMLCNYCSGLCMPEIAAMGAVERLDMMLNDALYGILFRDINMQRTLIDQYFSRMINGLAGIIINTGEDNYLTTDDALDAAHTVLASQFINEQLALHCGLPPEQIGLGHAMEIDPSVTNGFLMELAQAQLAREVFPGYPLKYMPPTKYMTGNVFRGLIQDALFNLVGAWTQQGIQLLGMHTEAMHTPHMGDRYLALESARTIMNNARDLGGEIEFRRGGIVQRRAATTVEETQVMLAEIQEIGLFEALSRGMFAAVRRTSTGGRGLDGVATRSERYFNPLETALRASLGLS